MKRKKTKKKRVNPQRIPVSAADVKRAKGEAEERALEAAWSIFFTVLRDKRGYTLEELRETWEQVEYLADSIAKGRCTVKDLRYILAEEEGVALEV